MHVWLQILRATKVMPVRPTTLSWIIQNLAICFATCKTWFEFTANSNLIWDFLFVSNFLEFSFYLKLLHESEDVNKIGSWVWMDLSEVNLTWVLYCKVEKWRTNINGAAKKFINRDGINFSSGLHFRKLASDKNIYDGTDFSN